MVCQLSKVSLPSALSLDSISLRRVALAKMPEFKAWRATSLSEKLLISSPSGLRD